MRPEKRVDTPKSSHGCLLRSIGHRMEARMPFLRMRILSRLIKMMLIAVACHGQYVDARPIDLPRRGTTSRLPGPLRGRGIHYDATHIESQLCEGEDVIVVGGGNSAGQAAVFLSQTARRVYMLVRAAELAESMSRYLVQRIIGNPSIELLCNSELIGLEGKSDLEEVSWIDRQTGQVRAARAHHMFMMAGAWPNTNWLRGRLALDDRGFILTGCDLPLAVEPDQRRSDVRKQPSWGIRCRRCPRWKREAGGCGRRRRSCFRESGASSSRRALVDRKLAKQFGLRR
jgi:hypothetical protein